MSTSHPIEFLSSSDDDQEQVSFINDDLSYVSQDDKATELLQELSNDEELGSNNTFNDAAGSDYSYPSSASTCRAEFRHRHLVPRRQASKVADIRIRTAERVVQMFELAERQTSQGLLEVDPNSAHCLARRVDALSQMRRTPGRDLARHRYLERQAFHDNTAILSPYVGGNRVFNEDVLQGLQVYGQERENNGHEYLYAHAGLRDDMTCQTGKESGLSTPSSSAFPTVAPRWWEHDDSSDDDELLHGGPTFRRNHGIPAASTTSTDIFPPDCKLKASIIINNNNNNDMVQIPRGLSTIASPLSLASYGGYEASCENDSGDDDDPDSPLSFTMPNDSIHSTTAAAAIWDVPSWLFEESHHEERNNDKSSQPRSNDAIWELPVWLFLKQKERGEAQCPAAAIWNVPSWLFGQPKEVDDESTVLPATPKQQTLAFQDSTPQVYMPSVDDLVAPPPHNLPAVTICHDGETSVRPVTAPADSCTMEPPPTQPDQFLGHLTNVLCETTNWVKASPFVSWLSESDDKTAIQNDGDGEDGENEPSSIFTMFG